MHHVRPLLERGLRDLNLPRNPKIAQCERTICVQSKKTVSSITGSADQLISESRICVLIARIELAHKEACRLFSGTDRVVNRSTAQTEPRLSPRG